MEQPLRHTLVAGFGNLYRRDDGVARFVVNTLRERLGRPPLDPMDDGFGDLVHDVDTVVLHQLVPELAEDLQHYSLVIFVDAHVGASMPEPIHEEPVVVTYRTPFVSHQTHPSTVLALTKQMFGVVPEAILLSVIGHDFDFGEGLSEETAALVPQAVDRIMELITPSGNASAGPASSDPASAGEIS
ncbi:MAG: hydrogenase maturation protease [Anaerolineae bacterium]|nr:hydrogenase maturation protease [Anaerolineae bacterium]